MRHGGIRIGRGICLVVGLWGSLYAAEPAAEPEKGAFENQPEARALYDGMIEALRKPDTLLYKSEYRWEARGQELGRCTYTVWLKKPNHFRVEGVSVDGQRGGTLIGDGQTLWLFWKGDRPHFSVEEQESYNKTRSQVYMKKPAPPGGHSIGHEVGLLGAGMSMPIIDPSTFFGYTDSLQPYLDGVVSRGTEKVGEEECDVIELSLMKHQRSWHLWLSKKDHLPRKLEQVIRVSHEILTHEVWSGIVMNGEMPGEKFVWTPPEGWQPWVLPGPEERLLKPGTAAPDFELLAVDGSKIKLSDYRDKLVWLYLWRAG